MMAGLQRAIAPIAGRVRMMIARAVIGTVDDSASCQTVQADLLDGERQDEIEHFQHYGFTSVAHPDAEVIIAFVAGLRSHGVVIAGTDRRYRLKGLATGEVAIHDDLGQVVHLTRDGIVIESDQRITVRAPNVLIDADQIDLGGAGGAAVARVGDDVDLGTGKIVSGSSKVASA